MSAGPEQPPPSFHRPRWIVPVAIVGALFLVVGVILALDWGGGDDNPPAQITTSQVVATTAAR